MNRNNLNRKKKNYIKSKYKTFYKDNLQLEENFGYFLILSAEIRFRNMDN